MNIIVVSRRHGRSRTISFGALVTLVALALVALVGLGIGTVKWFGSQEPSIIDQRAVKQWQQRLVSQESELARTRDHTEEQIRALTVKLAELQSRLTRLDALGERLVDVAELDDGEFDFTIPPAVGGPEVSEEADAYNPPEFVGALEELSSLIDSREQQLSVLNSLLGDRKIQSATFVAGRPIERGWMSSRYGYRNDPFNGQVAWHDGVDFAGKDGSNIVAVAAGVVTWASERYGYGNLVEVNHGNGYVTRYAHAKEILVNVGDVVKKNDVIALMGSTGRSTGPHVHFEVLQRGKSVDPAEYINRVARF